MIRRYFFSIVFIVFISYIFTPFIYASDCLNNANNIFGIGLAQAEDQDLVDAALLVNSKDKDWAGDWGYVTLVIQEDDRNREKWQTIFDRLRELHLIPIIRLATRAEGASWRRPDVADAAYWAEFLNSLNWVVEHRYIILFNEPNHANEWGGEVNPENYAEVVDAFSKRLKSANKDFFIMLAGFDAAAPDAQPLHLSLNTYLRRLKDKVPNIFDNIDGWASHSYANPGFVGTHYGVGSRSVRSYHSELLLLEQLGIRLEQVFITETGWPHAEGLETDNKLPTAAEVANIFVKYYENIRGDKRICAITPFILNYQGGPFDHFSWKKLSATIKGESCEDKFYPQYCEVQKIPKIKGDPIQKELIGFKADLPVELTEDSVHNLKVNLTNEGQAIWDTKYGYKLGFIEGQIGIFCSNLENVKPKSGQTLDCSINTPKGVGNQKITLGFYKGERLIQDIYTWNFKTSQIPKLSFRVGLLPAINKIENDYEIQIFDKNERLVFNKSNIPVINGLGVVTRVPNIALGEEYRVVLLKAGYLPRQEYVVMQKEISPVKFKTLLGFDRDLDGQFTIRGDVMGIKTK